MNSSFQANRRPNLKESKQEKAGPPFDLRLPLFFWRASAFSPSQSIAPAIAIGRRHLHL